jgi:hypothetical protein
MPLKPKITTPVDPRTDEAVRTVKEKKTKNTAAFVHSSSKTTACVIMAVFFVFFSLTVFATLRPAPAMAEQARIFQGAFGCEKTAGCETAPDPYPLAAEPWSVAVNDETDDVYVADGPNQRIEEFGPKGEFVLMFGKEVNKTKSTLGNPASQAEKDLCTAFEECQAGTPSSAPGGFESESPVGVMFVAVDNDESSPSHGDVYVGVYNEKVAAANRVSKFDASGQLVSGWGEGATPDGQLTGAGVTHPPAAVAGPFGHIYGVAVDPAGNLWVATPAAAFEFGQEAKLGTDWANPVPSLPFGIAVDAQDDLYLVVGRPVKEVTGAGVEVGRITEPGEEEHPINSYGVAVDPTTNDLYVLDEPSGYSPQREQLQRYELPCSGPFKESGCKAAETFTNNHLTAESVGHGLAINPDPSKTLYVTSFEKGEVRSYSVVTVPGVSTGRPSAVSGTAATLEGTVDPSGVGLVEGVEGCRFEWGLAGGAYEHTVACAQTAAKIGSGLSPVDVSSLPIAVVAGKTYHYRLVAANANDLLEPSQGGDLVFGPPVVGGEWNASVTAGTAQLRADVSPQNLATRVRLEYGLTASYGKTAPEEAVVAAGSGEQVVGFELRGLVAGTEYHYRFVAENALGEGPGVVVGPDRVFTTQGEGSFRLPDARAYELVSARDRHGAVIEPLGSSVDAGGQIQASGVGGGVTYVTNIPTESGVKGFTEFGQVLSTRGPSGWVSKDLSVPHSASFQTGVTFDDGREYRLFSEDLSQAAVQPAGGFAPCTSALGAPQPCVSPAASEQTSFLEDTETGLFTPLVTGCPSPQVEEEGHPCPPAVSEHANVPPGTVFGQKTVTGTAYPCPGVGVLCGPYFEDATPDFSHVVVDSYARLTEEPDAPVGEGLYEWTAGKLAFVGAGNLGVGVVGLGEATDVRHAISEDGERVFWTAGQEDSPHIHIDPHLYMRDTATGEDLQLDVPEAGCVKEGKCLLDAEHKVQPEFQFASSEGERVFFTDTQRLTLGSGASNATRDLYECEIVEEGGKPACNLMDLTSANGTEPAGVQGVLPGASEDGSYVYFVANGILANHGEPVPGAVSGDCVVNKETAPGQLCNLYVWHEGQTKLVAVLSGMDAPDWGALYLSAPTSRVSPNGRYLAFMSNRSLTGYDNTDVDEQPTLEEQEHGVSASAHVQRHDEEVYLYDAATGRTSCASCDPTGARPHGREYQNEHGEGLENGLVGSFKVWYPKTWLAANVPTWTPQTYDVAIYQSRYLSDEGRLFFNSSDGLVPKDVNEQEDVYEYEPQGVPAPAPGETGHACASAAASGSEVYKPAHAFESGPVREGEKGLAGEEGAGCVALISSGTSGEESAFMDASAGGGEGEHGVAGSAGGGDVFFLTAAHLVGGEIENGESLYDAHECTANSPCTQEAQAPPECETAEGCRAAPEPQPSIYTAPASATFNGLGNPAPEPAAKAPAKKVTKKTVKCHKGFIKNKKGQCVKQKKHTKAKKAAHTNRRAK